MEEIFEAAEQKVERYFAERDMAPTDGTLRLGGNRHILVRNDTLAFEFSQTIRTIYRHSPQANEIFLSIMVDVAHAAGASDARKFPDVMRLSDPIEKLSVGPVCFACTGFARVVIHAHRAEADRVDRPPDPPEDQVPTVGVSIGAIFVKDGTRRLDGLLDWAAAAMYAAKRSGKNRVCLAGADDVPASMGASLAKPVDPGSP